MTLSLHSSHNRQISSRDLGQLKGTQTPRIGTPRNPDRLSAGPKVAALAAALGEPFIPWQAHALDVALELGDRGRWAHETVAVLVARQNGKTRALKYRILAELVLFGGRRVLHTAQDRAVPRELFLELVAQMQTDPRLDRLVAKIREANGQEVISLTNGGEYRILAPQQDRFRSWPASLVVFDEAREHRSLDLGDAARPTLRMARRPQLWYVSNAGDPASIRLNVTKARGEEAVANPDADPAMCYLEWSAATDDPYDVDGWVAANPALGYLLPHEAIVEELRDAEASGDFTGFLTEGLCRWVEVSAVMAVPLDAWNACRARRRPKAFTPGADRMVLAVDVDPERREAALVAIGFRRNRFVVSVVDRWHDPDGISDALVGARVIEWATEWSPEAIGYDPYTSSGIAAEVAARFPTIVEPITGTNYLTACGQLWDATVNGRLRHMGDPWLDDQIAVAGRKAVGDGTWRIARLEASRPIPGVMALVRAIHLAYRPRLVPEVM